MKVIPGVLVLLAVSSVSVTASAGKFDFGSVLESVLISVISDPEKVRKYEKDKQSQKIMDDLNERSRLQDLEDIERRRKEDQRMDLGIEYSNSACDSIERCDQFPNKRRAISGDLENIPYICELDDSEGASRQGYIERNRTTFDNFVYASKQWLDAEKQCHQRLKVQEEERIEESRRYAALLRERQDKIERDGRREMAEISKRPEPKVGMSKDQVRKSRWGNPITKSITTDAKGTYEKWAYISRTLYFTNGKLAKIEQIKF